MRKIFTYIYILNYILKTKLFATFEGTKEWVYYLYMHSIDVEEYLVLETWTNHSFLGILRLFKFIVLIQVSFLVLSVFIMLWTFLPRGQSSNFCPPPSVPECFPKLSRLFQHTLLNFVFCFCCLVLLLFALFYLSLELFFSHLLYCLLSSKCRYLITIFWLKKPYAFYLNFFICKQYENILKKIRFQVNMVLRFLWPSSFLLNCTFLTHIVEQYWF